MRIPDDLMDIILQIEDEGVAPGTRQVELRNAIINLMLEHNEMQVALLQKVSPLRSNE